MGSDKFWHSQAYWNIPNLIQPLNLKGPQASSQTPIPETKTRPELALWLPTHSDLISDQQRFLPHSTENFLLPSSQIPGTASSLPGGVSEQLPLQRVLT